MAKKSEKKSPRRSPRARAKDRVAKVVDQVREPFSLLSTLKEEGMANAMALFGLAGAVASGATKNLRMDAIKPQLFEILTSMGFALREDMEKLEARIEELETKISAKEFEELRGASDEQE